MLKLILPVIFPSWRFFSSIGPSPRIHYAFLQNENDEPQEWFEFRPRPGKVSFKESLCRLFHNPHWNETLYLNTCAERLFEGYSEMREQEIMTRILAAVTAKQIAVAADSSYLVYKISAVIREAQVITQPVTFVAKPVLLKGIV